MACWWGCSASEAEPGQGSCGNDDDCKGDRVCEDGECVDPGTASSGDGGGTGSGTGSGASGAAPATECLSEVKCANQLDCPNGHHCNTAIALPVCQELYCGGPGSACDADELCQQDLRCLDGACTVPPDCQSCCEDGESCGGFANIVLYNPNPITASCLDWHSLSTWAPLKDCVCSACAGTCDSWCSTGEWPTQDYQCIDCIYRQTGHDQFEPNPACVAAAEACNAD